MGDASPLCLEVEPDVPRLLVVDRRPGPVARADPLVPAVTTTAAAPLRRGLGRARGGALRPAGTAGSRPSPRGPRGDQARRRRRPERRAGLRASSRRTSSRTSWCAAPVRGPALLPRRRLDRDSGRRSMRGSPARPVRSPSPAGTVVDTGDLDPGRAPADRSDEPGPARRADRAELTMAARSVAKVWLLPRRSRASRCPTTSWPTTRRPRRRRPPSARRHPHRQPHQSPEVADQEPPKVPTRTPPTPRRPVDGQDRGRLPRAGRSWTRRTWRSRPRPTGAARRRCR